MKKLWILLLMTAILTACNSKDEKKPAETPQASTSAAILVKVKTLEPVTFNHYITANGSVEAVNDAFISPEINGQVKQIHVKEGQRVQKGQLLVTLNADVIRNSMAEVKNGLELATTVYNKRKALWEKNIGSEIQYLQAKTEKESLENRLKTLESQLAMAEIKAPISGIVDEIFNKEGELALPGMQLIRLIDLKQVYVNADVSEDYLPNLKKGETVWVTFPSFPGKEIKTSIHRIGNEIKKQNRTFLIQILLDNTDETLKPNLIALIKMNDYTANQALTVPSLIIKNDMKGSYVYIVEPNEGKSIARKTYVTAGMVNEDETQITEGLQAGQQVIVDGYHLVKNGLEIQIEG